MGNTLVSNSNSDDVIFASSGRVEEYVPSFKPNIFAIACFNVLRHSVEFHDILCSKQRYQKQLQMFRDIQADVLCLTEVTSEYVELLQKDEWIRKMYPSFCHGIVKTSENQFFGNLVLTRYPLVSGEVLKYKSLSLSTSATAAAKVGEGSFSTPSASPTTTLFKHGSFSHKASVSTSVVPAVFAVAAVEVGVSPKKIGVLSIQLSIDPKTRNLQLMELQEMIKAKSPECDELFVVGDFGVLSRELESAKSFLKKQFLDMWLLIKREEETATVDPFANQLALKLGYQQRQRSDRILQQRRYRHFLHGHDMFLFGVQPLCTEQGSPDEYLFPSSHFGVIVELKKMDEVEEMELQMQ